MKNLCLIILSVFTLLQNELKAQCTDPPEINYVYPGIYQCGDFYEGRIYSRPQLSLSDTTLSYTYNLYEYNDFDKTNLIYTFLDSSIGKITNQFLPFDRQGFFIEVIAKNNCGSDTITRNHLHGYWEIEAQIPQVDSTCGSFEQPYITGPDTVTRCESQLLYVINDPNEQNPIIWNYKYRYSIISNGDTLLGDLTTRNIIIKNIPTNDFEIRVIKNDTCTCLGFNPSWKFLTSKFVKIGTSGPCGSINGTLYSDIPNNCFTNQNRIPRRVVALKNDYYAYTNDSGYFEQGVPFGNYELSAIPQYEETDCNTAPFDITIDANNIEASQDLNVTYGTAYTRLDVYSSRSRIGRQNYAGISIENYSTPFPNASLTFEIPEKVDMNTLSFYKYPSPTNISNRTITWDNINIDQNDLKYIGCRYELMPNAEIDDELTWYATLTTQTILTDSAISIVTNSFDPNEVVVDKNEVLNESDNKTLKYTVHFQNTGNDIAYFVRVVDTLDAKLDMSTLLIANASHNFNFNIISGNVMEWTFNNINLADSASNEAGSKGWFNFSVDFKEDVVVNDFANSTAHIYFDTNEPIVTNTAVSTITEQTSIKEFSSIDFSLYPNPAQTVLNLVSNEKISSYQIITIDGRIIKQDRNISLSQQIDIRSLANGIYYLKVTNNNGIASVKPFEKL
jgi:hypothetical protein